jgi:hypothetical protein
MVKVASNVERCAGRSGAADRSHRFGFRASAVGSATGVAGAGTGD